MVRVKLRSWRTPARHRSKWYGVVLWWRAKNYRYGRRWRLANTAVAALLLAAVISPVAQLWVQAKAYALSASTLSLVGRTDPRLTKQLTFDPRSQQYQFNKVALGGSDLPPQLQHATVGTPGSSSNTYALDVPADMSQGVTYHDVNSQLSFKLVPRFKSMQGRDVDGHLVYPLKSGVQAIYTLKGNGLKEDIVVRKVHSDTMTFAYRLQLPKTLEAKSIPDSGGAIGIYSADPSLFGDVSTGSTADQAQLEKARENAEKTYLVFGLPSPVIKAAAGGSVGDASARFELDGDDLSVIASGLDSTRGPITIDPSVVVTSTSDFQAAGNNEGMIDFSTSDQITRGVVTAGKIGAWTTSPNNLATAGEKRGAVAYNGYLYSVGGVGGSNNTIYDVQYAQINSGGGIGPWQSTTSLPSTAGATRDGAMAYNGYLYTVASYNDGSGAVTTTMYAKINTDGTLESTWHKSASNLPISMVPEPPQVYNGYIYLMGGWDSTDGVDTNTTYYAPIEADGSVGTWTQNATVFTNVRESTATAVYGGYLYIMGGLNYVNSVFSYFNDVQYARINSDGSVGTWATGASFATARTNTTAVAYDGYLYLFGGSNSTSIIQSDVQYAPIYANGSLGAWASTAVLPQVLRNVAPVGYGNYLYLLGGFDTNNSVQATTLYASINAAPDPSGGGGAQTFGKTTAGTSTDSYDANYDNCSKYTASSSGAVTSMSANVGTINTNTSYRKFQLAVYDATGSSGGPGTLIASSVQGTLTAAGWNSVSINASVTSGTAYWLCYNTNSNSGSYNNLTFVTGASNTGGYTSATFGSYSNNPSFSFSSYNYAIYATVSPGLGFGGAGSWANANSGSSFTTVRAYGASVAYNGYMYMIGGYSGSAYLNDVQAAPIDATTGKIGTWQYTHSSSFSSTTNASASFTNPRTALAATAYNGYLYVLGGYDGTKYYNDVQYAPINADGTIGTWATTTSFATGRSYLAVATSNGYLYLMGGTDGTNYHNDVQYAQITSTGALESTWHTAATSFTTARASFAAAAYNNYLYIMGGTDGSVYHNDVQYAKLNSDGTVGTWATTASFTTARDGLAARVFNGFLYILGGYTGSEQSDVQYTAIKSDGTLSGWSSTSGFTTGRDGAGTAIYHGYLYILGGYTGSYANDVQYTSVHSPALIGHYSKLVDLGTVGTLTGITYSGSLPNGLSSMTYRSAGSNGIFTSSGKVSDLSNSCTGSVTNVRYVLVMISLDDSSDGLQPGATGSAYANVTDFTVTYKTGHPGAAIRLHGGKTLQNGILSPLDINSSVGSCSG